MRRGLLGLIPMPSRPSPSAVVGSPPASCVHVAPPSVLLNKPEFWPLHAAFSHGPCRASHNTAYTVFGSFGDNTTSAPPVFSSLYNTFSNDRPPFVER